MVAVFSKAYECQQISVVESWHNLNISVLYFRKITMKQSIRQHYKDKKRSREWSLFALSFCSLFRVLPCHIVIDRPFTTRRRLFFCVDYQLLHIEITFVLSSALTSCRETLSHIFSKIFLTFSRISYFSQKPRKREMGMGKRFP